MSRKILIVDDSKLVIEILKSTLLDAGYNVCSAENGKDALALVGDKHYDLLMSDLNMPEMDGIEFISEVRKMPGRRFLPIVILSGDEKSSRFSECAEAGASGYLQKPFDKDQVLGVLKMIIPY